MYFNDNKNDTNIDDEFDSKGNFLSTILSFFNKYKLYVITGVVVIIIIIMILIFAGNGKSRTYLDLLGEADIVIYEGSDYIEPGYKAYDNKSRDLNSSVEIVSNLNNKVIGEYEITYRLGDIVKTRNVSVISKNEEYTFLVLNTVEDNVTVYLKVGEEYVEPGFNVLNSSGRELNDQVKITGSVNTSKKGTYKLTYSLTDPNNVLISKTRNVIVMDTDISLNLSNSSYTNKNVTISVAVADEYFDYIILPNNNKVNKNIYSYEVSSNGTYTFKSYNKKGIEKTANIVVNNIDKTAPTGSCSGSYQESSSVINVSANDNVGIGKYVVNGVTYNSSKITINKKMTTANVTIYDKAGNTKNISCNLEKKTSTTTSKPTESNPSEKPSGNTGSSNITSVNSSFFTENNKIKDADIVKMNVKDLSCTIVNGYNYTESALRVHRKIADNFHGILGLVCDFVNESPYIDKLQHDGTYVSTVTGYHSRGLAIDMNDLWFFTYNGKKYYPYSQYSYSAWNAYEKFVCEVCDGKEDCPYNINYIIYNRYFKGNGWCWGGNWGPKYFDPMHFELTEYNACTTENKAQFQCDKY